MEISFANFIKFKINVGTILSSEKNVKATNPAFVLNIDFGPNIGIKKTSAQITNYNLNELVGLQVIAVTNFPPKQIAGVISEVLVLGGITKSGIKLLTIDEKVKNGTIIG